MHPSPELRLDLLEFRPQAITPGLPMKLEATPSRFPADVGETQEVEGFRLSEPARLSSDRREAAELKNAGLLRMECQCEGFEPLPHHVEKATCVALGLEADDQIIGIAHDDHVALGFLPSPAIRPQVEHVVQVDVRQER